MFTKLKIVKGDQCEVALDWRTTVYEEDDLEDDDLEDDDEEDPKKRRKRKYKLWVENLTDKTSPRELRDLFERDGELIEIQIHSFDDVTTAKVTMNDCAASFARERLNGMRWRDRVLKVTILGPVVD
jgi:RNA recognition motif-containing protein